MFPYDAVSSSASIPGLLSDHFHPVPDPLCQPEVLQHADGPYQHKVDTLTAHMVGQAADYDRAVANADRIFAMLLDETHRLVDAFKGSLVQRMQPLVENGRVPSLLDGRVSVLTDADCSVGILHMLWQTLSFTTRGGVKPLALGRPGRPPVFSGRIIAFHGDYLDARGPLQTQNYPAILQHEIASLFIPSDPVSPASMKVRHRPEEELYFTQQEAARQFLLKVVEMTCGGGFFHEGTP